MYSISHFDNLSELFSKLHGHAPLSIVQLPGSGSARLYFRIESQQLSCIGTFNDDIKENETFIYLTEHLFQRDIPVPRVLGVSDCRRYYLQSDLGSLLLFDKITDINSDTFEIGDLIGQAISGLARFNILGFDGIDESKLYPVPHFDIKSVMWDLYYFKYCFLKPSGITFNEVELENVFGYLAEKVLNGDNQFLQFRDFQSRNIMILDSKPFFIDYQSARIGSGLYDLASFLYQARANLSDSIRQKLLLQYIDELSKYRLINRSEMVEQFPYMAIFRILQTLGAYGFRGLFERKTHFIQSIPLALQNLGNLLETVADNRLPYLYSLQQKLLNKYKGEQCEDFDGLTVKVYSFSIKNGYPPLNPEHGGGFVFDCRYLPNPAQLDVFQNLTGLDKPVIDYLLSMEEVKAFCHNTFLIVKSAIDKYLSRNFKHLSIGFGCTGGQHRSVFCAEQLFNHLNGIYSDTGLRIMVKHMELEKR